MDVTVVVPTHNRLGVLPAAIRSILDQRGVSTQVVVVDDGSTDGSGPWLDHVASQDRRVEVVHHEFPKRSHGARNAGIARAQARWIAFCDDDDLWAPDKLITQLEALRRDAARWGCTAAVAVDEKLRVIGHHHVKGGDILPDLLKSNAVPTGGSSVIAERDLLRELGGFDEGLVNNEDWDMWIRLAQRSPVAAVDRPLVAYRQGIGTRSANIGQMRTTRSAILARYGAGAGRCGVHPDDAHYERFLAKQLLRAGSGKQAACIFAHLVVKHHRWRDVPRMAAALLAPGLTDRIGTARAAAAVPTAWSREAEAWIRPFRQS
jgi:glycosyltransferase involved in cell wall biosynthesis